ncbi:MAG TPA: BON domain-containing protein [Bacteroidia bacterium]|nr:BON domain-containing protein [Bacteroidia bacterium]
MRTDAEIEENVIEELKWGAFLNDSEIEVSVTNGVATLWGTVDTYAKKLEAERAAKRVKGVKAVAEEIEVGLHTSNKKNDTELALAITNALKWQSAVQEDKIKVKVENGWVTLEGVADWAFEREAAELTVRNLTGIKGVSNLVTIKPAIMTNDIKQKITDAFQRSATIDSGKINIEVTGNKVTLKGKVSSWTERNDAENVAWNAPGIVTVDNKLTVDSEEILAH